MRYKDRADLVSQADIDSELSIVAVIRVAFPDHAILGEELHRADVEADHLWIIDPLDGTTNFLHGIPHFAVSIAYYERAAGVRSGVQPCAQ
ncbi:MAG: inositol monophosphatase [Planctomycetaceae bacterium]